MGKFLIILGLVIMIMGLMIHFNVKIPWLGKLPGDILIKKENSTFYFPLTSSILISIILSIIFFILGKFK